MAYIESERTNCLVLKKYRHIDSDPQFEKFRQLILSKCGIPIQITVSENIPTVIMADIERSVDPSNYESVKYVLYRLYSYYGDYCQGLSYLASFFLVFLNPEQTLQFVLYFIDHVFRTNIHTASLVGLHAHISIMNDIINSEAPELRTYMNTTGLILELFSQKYFYGCCINVLNASDILVFFTSLLEQGCSYLYSVVLGVLREAKNRNLKTISDILNLCGSLPSLYTYEISNTYDFDSMLKQATVDIELRLLGIDNDYSDDEIVFSDEEI